jgi:hypothetical protein
MVRGLSIVFVRPSRSLRVLLGVVLALGVRTVVAAPLQAAAEMRAVSHCMGHMNRPVSVPESRRCCNVSSDAGAPAKLSAAPASVAAPVVLPVARPATAVAALLTPAVQVEWRRERDGPPLYLGLRTIRC